MVNRKMTNAYIGNYCKYRMFCSASCKGAHNCTKRRVELIVNDKLAELAEIRICVICAIGDYSSDCVLPK